MAVRKASTSSIEDTARYLGLDEREFMRLIDEGRIRVIPPSSVPAVHESDLRAFLATTQTDTVTGEITIPRRSRLPKLLRRA